MRNGNSEFGLGGRVTTPRRVYGQRTARDGHFGPTADDRTKIVPADAADVGHRRSLVRVVLLLNSKNFVCYDFVFML